VARFKPAISLDWPARLGFLLTFLKIPLTAIVVSLLFVGNVAVVNALIIFAMIIDIADGVIFNRSSHSTNRYLRESRRIWDGALDRLLIWTTLTAALLTLSFPKPLFAAIMIRELAVCAATSLPYLRSGFVHSPNWCSKVGAILIAVQFIYFTVTGGQHFLLFASFALSSSIGLVLYIARPQRV
jgi:phosphatidylglycerophosphate synthase